MRVLISGGFGFIGNDLISCLLKNNCDVSVISPRSEPSDDLKNKIGHLRASLEDSERIDHFLSLNKFDCLVHLVGAIPPFHSSDHIVEEMNDYLLNSVKFFKQVIQHQVKRIIFISSAGALYVSGNELSKEDDAVNPKTFYGLNKLYLEESLKILNSIEGVGFCNLRVSNVYGPGQIFKNNQGVIANFCNKIQNGMEIEVWGDGENRKDYIYISDLSDLIYRAISSDQNGTFNAGSGQSFSVNRILELISKEYKLTPQVRYINQAKNDNLSFGIDSSLSKKTYGWRPTVSLEVGIGNYVQWLRAKS